MNRMDSPEIKKLGQNLFQDFQLLFIEEIEYDEILESLFNLAADLAPQLIMEKKITSTTDKLKIYGLFKQAEFGDVKNQTGLSKDSKYYAWKKQHGKSKEKCWEEYIQIISKHSRQMKSTLKGLVEGTIDEFQYER